MWILKYLIYLLTIVGIISCADHKLSIKKQPNRSNKIRLDGFYYNVYRGNPENYSLRFLYRDGTVFHCGWLSVEEFANIQNFVNKEVKYRRKYKVSWGKYIIQGNAIIVEGWNTSVGGGLPSYKLEGHITNDTTIIITNSKSNENILTKSRSIIDTPFFRKFSPKPDSTNNFIH